MPKLILIIACALLLMLGWHQWQRLTPLAKRRLTSHAIFWAIALIILIGIVSGRLHWLSSIGVGIAYLLKFASPKLISFAPSLFKLWQKRSVSTNTKTDLSDEVKAAFVLLGLAPTASKQEVIEAHRKLMQSHHPDKGGSDEEAAALNRAKQILLDYLNQQ